MGDLSEKLRAPDPADDQLFHELVAQVAEAASLTERDFAREMDTSVPTARRWLTGVNAPHPATRPRVYEWLREKLASMTTRRFPFNADTFEEATAYFKNRAVQLLVDDFKLTSIKPLRFGARAIFRRGDTEYQSIYVYKSERNRGHMKTYVALAGRPFVTVRDCDVEEWFKKHHVVYALAGKHMDHWVEYEAIQSFYGDRKAARSGLFYMNHIDEGLAILKGIGATVHAMRAFCLHPLLQADADLDQSYWRLAELTESPRVLALAMEYRNIANAYLAHREISSISEIALSPIDEVNTMLCADKIQNYKDFLAHHAKTHPRAAALNRYFKNWLKRLNVPMPEFKAWREKLRIGGFDVGK